MEQTLDKSPVLRESVMALFTEQKVDHENRPQISRAESQVRKWNKEAGKDLYESKITHKEPAGEGSRERILEYEKERADRLRDELDSKKHKRP